MKTDPALGKEIHQHLTKLGVETPVVPEALHLNAEYKLEEIERSFAHIMDVLGLDRSDDSLIDTPKRVAKMYVNEIFSGLNY